MTFKLSQKGKKENRKRAKEQSSRQRDRKQRDSVKTCIWHDLELTEGWSAVSVGVLGASKVRADHVKSYRSWKRI